MGTFFTNAFTKRQNLIIGVPKSAEDITKLLARHDAMELKCITYVHGGICGGPPVMKIWYSIPEIHVDLTTNPIVELLNIHQTLQNRVCLQSEDLIQKFYWEKN